MMLVTLKQLILATPKKITSQHSDYLVETYLTKGGGNVTALGVVKKPRSTEVRKSSIVLVGASDFSIDNPAQVDCSCPYFSYTLETALAAVGATPPKRWGGAYPRKTNPQMIPGLCVHILATIARILLEEEEQE